MDIWAYAFHSAAANWLRWEDEYTCCNFKNRAMLNDVEVFSSFCSEYNLSRNIPGDSKEKDNKNKALLANKRREVVMNYFRNNWDDSKNVDDFASELANFSNGRHTIDGIDLPDLSKRGKQSQVANSISLVSKVLSFSDPCCFPPYDTYVQNISEKKTYVEYKDWFGLKFSEKLKTLNTLEKPNFVRNNQYTKFQARVLDVVCMVEGNRWN